MSARHARTRCNAQYREVEKAKAAVWFVMRPVGIHLHMATHTHAKYPFLLSQVMLHKLKSMASGGNSLKSAASSALKPMIPLG